jgi:hypothetical protein
MAYRLHPDWHGEPLNSMRGFELIAVAPVTPVELYVFVEDEFIYGCDHVEVTLPRDVIGLKDANFFN